MSLDTASQCRRLEERLRVLSEATHAFADATSDTARLLDVVARRVAEVVKDFCVVLLVSDDGLALEPAAAFDPDPETLRQLRDVFSEPYLLESTRWGAAFTRAASHSSRPNSISNSRALRGALRRPSSSCRREESPRPVAARRRVDVRSLTRFSSSWVQYYWNAS